MFFCFLFRLSTLKLYTLYLSFHFWKCIGKLVKCTTTFAPAENSTFVLNEWFMHTQSQLCLLL